MFRAKFDLISYEDFCGPILVPTLSVNHLLAIVVVIELVDRPVHRVADVASSHLSYKIATI